MQSEPMTFELLDRRIGQLVSVATPSDVFKLLLESAPAMAPRASVFLVRQGQAKGWGATGFDAEAARRQRSHAAPAGEGWLGEVAASAEPVLRPGPRPSEIDFGQPAAGEVCGVALRVKGRPIALIVLERAAGEEPWVPAAMTTLVRIAQVRLDLDLVRRKLEAASAAATGEPTGAAAASAAPNPTTAPAPTPAAAPVPSSEPSGADDEKLDAARRYARLVATDIRLYNEEAVLLGRKNGDLVARLDPHLRRGKETFLRRHGALGPAGLEILREAFVQVLAGGDEEQVPASVLE
jgi:hypothetical protein